MPSKITPMLWYDGQAEEAARHYVAIFPNSKIDRVSHYPEGTHAPAGSVMTVEFTLEGQSFTALNAGPAFRFNEAISLVVDCKDQKEVDYYWDRLGEGGTPQACGWIKDRYGLCWQVTPRRLIELTTGPDKARAQRVFAAMMTMIKLDVKALEEAAR